MDFQRISVAAAAACLAIISQGASADSNSNRVGVTSAVNPSAAGTPPGAASRQLTVGGDILFRERVITTTDGQAQILFLDQSSLLIGPNSTVVIDEFVYDPATNKGNMAATLTQGSFRYIGGKLSKQGNATLKTPVATLGIRGSDVTVGHNAANQSTDVVTTHGSATVTSGSNVVALRGGFGMVISGLSGPGTPASLTAAQIAAVNRVFEGLPGKNGGLEQGKGPTDGDVAKSGLSQTVEAQGLAAIAPAAGGSSANDSVSIPFAPGNNDTQLQAILPPPPPPPPPQSGAPATRTDRTMNGYVAGIGEPTPLSNAPVAFVNTQPTDVTIRTIPDTDGIGRVLATFNYRQAQDVIINAPPQMSSTTRIELGDPLGANPATQSIFVDDQAFGATQMADAAAGKATRNGSAVSVDAFMIAVPMAVPVGTLTLDGRGPACDCQFVTWGIWGTELRSSPSNTLLQSVPNGVWAAGVLPALADQPGPGAGTATFSGTAIGAVIDHGSQRMASGAFTNAYNFATKSGLVNITNFDGAKSFGGTVSASDWRNYSGAVSGSGLTGSVNGSFYGTRNAANQVQLPKETAGNFAVRGSSYNAAGIFVGARP
jgi:hypothetical protein